MDIDEMDRAIPLLAAEEDADEPHPRRYRRPDRRLLDYHLKIDYETAGVPHHVLFVCTAPISKRMEFAEAAIDVSGVVDVRELLTGNQNLHVEVVCLDTNNVESVAEELDGIGLEIDHSEILRREYSQPFDHFGSDLVDESDDE